MHLDEKQNKINYIHCLFYKQVIQKFSEVEQRNLLNEQHFSPFKITYWRELCLW